MFSAVSAPGWLAALLRLEIRRLWQNRPACLVLVLLIAAPILLRSKGSDASQPEHFDCYVVYWQDNDWVAKLRKSAQHPTNRKLRIAVVPVQKMADAKGLITYPAGAHSIQLRPLPALKTDRPRWMIWCWYAGSDPDALRPYTRWFWDVTESHFADGPAWDVRFSALQLPMSSPIAGTSLDRMTARNPAAVIQVGILMLAVFFCACYLPVLELTQDRADLTIYSVALTTSGWNGIAVAKWLFHVFLAVMVAVVILFVGQPRLLTDLSVWTTVIAAALAYLGLGFVIGSLCRSSTTASAAIVAYGLLAAGLLYGAHLIGAEWASYLVMERSVCVILLGKSEIYTDLGNGPLELIALCGLACVWQVLGIVCYRRSCRG